MIKKPDVNIIIKVLNDGIYYYNKFGNVGYVNDVSISYKGISGSLNRRMPVYFKWEDLGIKFWLTKEEAEKNAEIYRNEIIKYISLEDFKKITKFKAGNTIYEKDEKNIWETTLGIYFHYSKSDLAFVNVIEYDDDYGGGYEEKLYYINQYGKTWALDREGLKNDNN